MDYGLGDMLADKLERKSNMGGNVAVSGSGGRRSRVWGNGFFDAIPEALICEAVCLLQEKAAHAFGMVEIYDDYHRKAIDRGDMSALALSYYAADTTRWQQKADRAAACARKLMGVE